MSIEPVFLFDYDADGHPRTVPVKLGNGVVVWHSHAEYVRLWAGVDKEAAKVAGRVPLERDTRSKRRHW